MTVLPATLNLKAEPFQQIYFAGRTHTADADGILRDVPYDLAMVQIKSGICVEAAETTKATEVRQADEPAPILDPNPAEDTEPEDADELEDAPPSNKRPHQKGKNQ